MLGTALALGPNPVSAAQGEMPSATDLQQKRSLISSKMPADYKAFERAIKSDYSPQTAIEGQLVTRLASLLWRLRRAVTIESGLLTIQAGIIRDHERCAANH